jgi:hypothetical protein
LWWERRESRPPSDEDDQASADIESRRQNPEDKVRRLRNLLEMRREAESGSPRQMTVRELLALWGARGRDSTLIGTIRTDLENHGLVTSPDFSAVTLDDRILIDLGDSVENSEAPRRRAEAQNESEDTSRPNDRVRRERGLTVGNLPSASRGILSITLNSTFEHAITKMLMYDYSQLAVMTGERRVHGAITWRSIAKARHQDAEAQLSAAITPVIEVPFDHDLIDVLPLLARDGFVFVRGPQQTISGIVTASDVMFSYGEMTSPFFLIGEIDQMLRWILEGAVDIPQILALCDPEGTRGIAGFAQLSMGDYQRVLENPDAWNALGWPLDRKVFIERLQEIRLVRNSIMHFNGDPLPDDVLSLLKNFLVVLREYSVVS